MTDASFRFTLSSFTRNGSVRLSIFSWLKPAPHIAEIQDENLVKKQYKYWRLRIFYGMYIGYIFYYFTRKSFTFAMPALMNELGFDKGDIGILASVLSISYGVSKFVSGVMADRSNPRYLMGFGLILTGIFNIFFGLSSSVLIFAVFWGLNGWFQGWGWPPCNRLLTHWYSQKERGRWWGAWNSSHSVGGAVIPLLVAVCIEYWGWRYAMYIPGAMCIAVGLFLINRLRDTPQSLGLPPIEKFKNDYPQGKKLDEKELSVKEVIFKHVINNKFIWVLAASYFFVYIVRTAVNDWTFLYFVQAKGYSNIVAGACVFWFEIGGICGSLIAGWASDRLFDGKRGPVSVLFCLGMVLAVSAFWFSPNIPVVDSILMFVVGFLVFGPQLLIGMAAAELSHKKAAATSNGFVGCFSYLGAAAAGYPLGIISEIWGWYGFFVVLTACCLISVALLLPLWSVKSNPAYTDEKAKEA